MIADCFPGVENMNLVFNSDVLNLLLKTNWRRGTMAKFVIFFRLEYFDCCRVGCRGVGQRSCFELHKESDFCLWGSRGDSGGSGGTSGVNGNGGSGLSRSSGGGLLWSGLFYSGR